MPLKRHHDFKLDDRGWVYVHYIQNAGPYEFLTKKKARAEINPKKQ